MKKNTPGCCNDGVIVVGTIGAARTGASVGVGRVGIEDAIGLKAPINGCPLGNALFAFASRVLTAFTCEPLTDAGMVILGCGFEMDGGSGTGFNDSFGGDFSD